MKLFTKNNTLNSVNKIMHILNISKLPQDYKHSQQDYKHSQHSQQDYTVETKKWRNIEEHTARNEEQ